LKLIEEILSNIKEAPVSLSVDLTEFIDNPIVYNLNIYDFYLQYYNSVKKKILVFLILKTILPKMIMF